MPLFELQKDQVVAVETTSLADRGVKERTGLQRVLRAAIDVVAPGTMVIAEEFSDWEDSRRRIDLLCVDTDANLVVVELKRDEEGGHMDLQAIRYAAMVSAMTFPRLVDAHQRYLRDQGQPADEAQARILSFLGWDEPHEDLFCRQVRIVLGSSDFSREVTTAVLWLIEHDLDIRCVRFRPHHFDGRIILDVQQVIPLPEASEFQVRLKEKALGVREAVRDKGGWSGYWFVNVGEGKGERHRTWEDCRDYGYVLAGGGRPWSDQLNQLEVGDRLFAYLSGHGYVGFGTVLAKPVMQKDFVLPSGERLLEMPLRRPPKADNIDDPDRSDYCVAVRWEKALERTEALRLATRRQTVCKLRDPNLVQELLSHFGTATSASGQPI